MNKLNLAILIPIFILVSSTAFAQKYSDFTFSDSVSYTLSEDVKTRGETILDRTYSNEYVIDEQGERCYTFVRTVRYVNSDEAIESNNKIYLYTNANTNYLIQIARVINPNGNIVLLQEEDILEGVFEDGGDERKYNYYALEGLEKGSIIEEVSYRTRSSEYYGEINYWQGSEYRLHQSFELICPSHLEFAFKPLNGAKEVEVDTAATENNRWYLEIDSIPEIENQSYFYSDVVKQGVIYKLDRNLARNKSDVTNYSGIPEYIYTRLKPEFSKKQNKQMLAVQKEMELTGKTKYEQIRDIEDYYKTNFNIIDNSDKQFENLSFIFENKATNSYGISALMIHQFETLDIDYQIIFTTDRSELRFDPKFEAYFYLQNLLFYFPKEKLYIAPGERYCRGKYIPETWTNNYGLFMREVNIGSISTTVGEIKFIEPLAYQDNTDIMDIVVDFTENIANPKISFSKSQMGYTAQYYQPFIHLFDDEEMTNFKNTLTDIIHEDIETDDLTISNIETNDFARKPFVIEFSTTKHRFVDQAGDDILFKVGELIGAQMELYHESERQFDIEKGSKQFYDRTITLHLPDNYEIKNTDVLNFEHFDIAEGDTTMFFSSSVSQTGNTVVITSIEYYDRIVYPVAVYDAFAKVVNAAADFNKITLVLKKK